MIPKFSVIVPNYNHASFLAKRLESILDQSFQDFELIILDDCSSDNSRDVIERYRNNPKVSHIVYNETNGGTAFKQWNKGISLAVGEWVWIAESDDWADLDFLETVNSQIELHCSCGLVYTHARYMRDEVETWVPVLDGSVKEYSGVDFIHHRLLYANVIYNVSISVFKKELFYAIDKDLYSNMHLCGDWYFYTLLSERTNVLEIRQLHSYYRVHTNNTSSKAERDGLTFLEGLDVLDYIVGRYKLKPREYAFQWGKALVKYERKYSFSRKTINEIKVRMMCSHLHILFFYYLIKVVYKVKRK